nr:ATP-binding protein [Sansalvadorimonas sp. 2012CJ34-2]
MRLGVINSAGWQIAETGEPSKSTKAHTEQPVWIAEWLFKTLLRWDSLPEYQAHWRDGGWQNSIVSEALEGQPRYLWLKDDKSYRLLSAWPLEKDGKVVGALVAEQGSHSLLAITWKALNKLFSLSFLVIVLAAAGLLGYASWLSLRIRKLNQATEDCIVRDGRLRTSFPVSRAKDEIGELSRSINTMLARLEEHTEYLRTLGSKLSHELRTPLAVVRSSLDNLEHENIHPQAQVYAERAMAGADRLGSLLSSISEATRLEAMIDDMASSEKEVVDLRQMLEDLYHAYSGAYPKVQFTLELPKEPCPVAIIPDLVVQAMDKLVSNAADFCPKEGSITLRLIMLKHANCIEVENDGELLPDSMQKSLFDSMVSVRKTRGDKAHLGLGLYIVRLVMSCHNGLAAGKNRDDKTGVVFQLQFPQ